MYQRDIQICLRFFLTKSLGIPGNRLILVLKHTIGGFQWFFFFDTATASVLNIYYERLVSPKRGTPSADGQSWANAWNVFQDVCGKRAR